LILDALKSKQIEALKQKDMEKLSTLRYLNSAVKNKEIDLRSNKVELQDKHILKVIDLQIKQRKDSIEEYRKGKRQDLADKEANELKILEELLAEFSE